MEQSHAIFLGFMGIALTFAAVIGWCVNYDDDYDPNPGDD